MVQRPSKLPRSAVASEGEADIARYIAEMAGELAALARHRRFDLLAYFLAMAEAEARTMARGADSSGTAGD